MDKISVIVPIFNVDKYLDRCIGSLSRQTYKNLEILLIDDGSKDNSGRICDDWAKKDKRIKVLHKRNGGVSSARNLGLRTATGSKIGFVDPDDFVDETMYEKLLAKMKEDKADIVMCGFKNYYPDDNTVKVEEYNLKTATAETLPQFFVSTNYTFEEGTINTSNVMGSIWRALFTKEILKGKKFRRLKFCEDLSFYMDVIKKNTKLSYLDEHLYYYVKRQGSALSTYSKKTFENRAEFDALLNDLFEGRMPTDDFDSYKFYRFKSQGAYAARSKDKELRKLFRENELLKSMNTRQNYKAHQSKTENRYDRFLNFLLHHNCLRLYLHYWQKREAKKKK